MSLSDWAKGGCGPYIHVVEDGLNLISIFDELKYDRSDSDIVSPAMRMHLVKKLSEIGFKQVSGSKFQNKALDICCHIPKSHALGASPFHIIDASKKREQDFYVLTPTQTACQFIKHFDTELAVERVTELIRLQPINIYRLSDYLEYEDQYHDFSQAIGHLKYVQRVAIETTALGKRRALSLTRH